MNKIFVNITSWTRIGSAGAEHFYATISKFQDDRNIFTIARDGWITTDTIELHKKLSQAEADYLNKKERTHTYDEGNKTNKFNSIDEIKTTVKNLYPNTDIAFFNDRELLSEDLDVFEANPNTPKKTGRKIEIHGFQGFSKEFRDLTENSIHEELEIPEKYEGKELQEGTWVMGVTEPVLVLRNEFIYI